jgi:hypothetical protein
VVVVLAAGVGRLVAGDAVDVDAVDELELGEHVERAVHAGQPDRLAAVPAQAVVDLLGAEDAVLAGEQREHLLTRATGPVAGARELAMRVLGPGRTAHGRDGSASNANENDFQ